MIAISDLHGHLPQIPQCDLLIIAGDICPLDCHNVDYQLRWLYGVFGPWARSQPAKRILATWGNHDFAGVHRPVIDGVDFLSDDPAVHSGLRIWGSPWTLQFHNWAFMGDEDFLQRKYATIPTNTDILISHGPPYGLGDRTPRQRCGSHALLTWIATNNPRLVVTGHIHEDYGVHRRHHTTVVNASLMDADYCPVNSPVNCLAYL